jgi:hypothetical protein
MIILEPWWVQCMGLLPDGSVVEIRLRETDRPHHYNYDIKSELDWKNVSRISSSRSHLVGLTKDGTIHTRTSSYLFEAFKEWKDMIDIQAGYEITVGLTSQGILLYEINAERRSFTGKYKNVKMIAAGNRIAYGLCRDGLLYCSDDTGDQILAEDWNDVVQLVATNSNVFGLSENGWVRSLIPADYEEITDWKNIVGISAGGSHLIGRTDENTLVAVGENSHHQCDVNGWKDIKQIFTGCYHTLAWKQNGEIVAPCNYWN